VGASRAAGPADQALPGVALRSPRRSWARRISWPGDVGTSSASFHVRTGSSAWSGISRSVLTAARLPSRTTTKRSSCGAWPLPRPPSSRG